MLKLADKNLGKPKFVPVGLIHGTVSVSEPQAWEENGKWYYNFSGAQAEAEGRGMEIPTAKQWKEIIDDMNLEKLNELLPKDGYRHPQYGNGSTRITGIGSMGGYWTSTKAKKKGNGNNVVVRSDSVLHENDNPVDFGLTVRCLK